jgi:hypothetical protein
MCRVFEQALPSIVAAAAKDGISLAFSQADDLDDCDLLVLHESVLDRDESSNGRFDWRQLPRKPYALLETNDSAHLTSGGRHAVAGDYPPAIVWKNSRYADPELYNRFHGRWHVKLAERDFEGQMRPYKAPKPLPAERLARIRVPFTFAAGSPPQAFLTAPGADLKAANIDRPINVTFAGWVDYPPPAGQTEETLVQRHRRALCDQLDRLSGQMTVSCLRGRPLDADAYRGLLWRSKVVACPSGWGELSWRVFEAINAGCEIVMSDCAHVADVPCRNFCRWDWADLEAVVRPVMARWSDPERVQDRREAREFWRQSSSLKAIGARLWRDLAETVVCQTR